MRGKKHRHISHISVNREDIGLPTRQAGRRAMVAVVRRYRPYSALHYATAVIQRV